MASIPRRVFRKPKRRYAAEEVYEALHEAIAQRRLPPGTRLNLEDLSAQFGVSETPVRAALLRLSVHGLVDTHSRQGTFVAHPTHRDLVETFDVLCALQALACEEAAPRLNRDRAERIRNAPDAEFDQQLEEMILEACERPLLANTCRELHAQIALAPGAKVAPAWSSQSRRAVIDALESRSPDALALAIKAHCVEKKKAFLTALATRVEKSNNDTGETRC